jgi:hypothetical protein
MNSMTNCVVQCSPQSCNPRHLMAVLPTPRSPYLTCLTCLTNTSQSPPPLQVSWCKLEVRLASPKQVLSDKHLSAAAASRPPPPLTVASLSLKTVINGSSHQNEIVAASVVHLQGVNMEVGGTGVGCKLHDAWCCWLQAAWCMW